MSSSRASPVSEDVLGGPPRPVLLGRDSGSVPLESAACTHVAEGCCLVLAQICPLVSDTITTP